MLKSGTKRRRTKQQIKDEKEAAQNREIEIQQKLDAAEEMAVQYQGLQRSAENNQNAHDILCGLIEKGVLLRDEGGNVQPVNLGGQ